MSPAPDSDALTCPSCGAARHRLDDHCEDCGASRPAQGWLSRTGLMLTAPAPEELVGSTVGPYRIQGLVASQGDGWLYRATSESGPTVDLWLFVQPDPLETWASRLDAARGLTHPHIRQVRDGGLHPRGVWMCAATSTAETAAQQVQQPSAPARAVTLALQLTDALQVLHGAGHTLTCLSSEDVQIHTTAEGTEVLTVPGAVDLTGAAVGRGATAWTAPEARRCGEGGARALQYTIGAFLYQALTGQRLPEDGTPPPPLNHSGLALPDALEAVTARLLRTDPSHRYEDLAEVQLKLSALRDTLVAPVPPAWTPAPATVEVSAASAAANRSTTQTALAIAVLAVLLSIGTLAVALAVAFRATQDGSDEIVASQLVAEPGTVTTEPAQAPTPREPSEPPSPSSTDAPAPTPAPVPSPAPEAPTTAEPEAPASEAVATVSDAPEEAPAPEEPEEPEEPAPVEPAAVDTPSEAVALAPELETLAAARDEPRHPVDFAALTGRYTGKVSGRPAVMRIKFAEGGVAGGTVEITVGSQPVNRPIKGRWTLDGDTLQVELTETEGPRPATYRGQIPARGGKLTGSTWLAGKDRGSFELTR